MKCITALLLTVVFTFGSVLASVGAVQADGLTLKAKGQWDFVFGTIHNQALRKSYNQSSDHLEGSGHDRDRFEARQRVRVQTNFIASDNLQGVLHFEIGGHDWGRDGALLDADQTNVIKLKSAYLDWIIPDTMIAVRMGIQNVALPAGPMGNPVFAADVAGIVFNAPITDNFSLTPFWLRPFDQSRYSYDAGFEKKLRNETDLFGLVAPLNFDGGSFSPYVMYGRIGNASGFWDYVFEYEYTAGTYKSGGSTNAWWLGANLSLSLFDPLEFSLDAIYGRIGSTRLYNEESDIDHNIKASGWYIGATLDYKLEWGTPGIFAWWASGDKSNANKDGNVRIGRLPVFGIDDGFYPTSFGTVGYYGIGNGGDEGVVSGSGAGTWGIGVQLADISFIEDLSHTLRFAYYRGTNSASLVKDYEEPFYKYAADPLYLTTKDSVLEVNFDHVYSIYENLEACLELAWLQLRSDRDTWGGNPDLKKRDNAWKAQLNFKYSF